MDPAQFWHAHLSGRRRLAQYAVLSRKQTGTDRQRRHRLAADASTLPAVPVVLDVKELVSTHLAIIASTGAGKSYLASVIIEEMMLPL